MVSINRKPAGGANRSGPSKVDLLGSDHFEGSHSLTKTQACELIAEYRRAARKASIAGLELGGRFGTDMTALGAHYARRASALAVLAGGLLA